ncbi:MAG: LysE family translocator [Rubrivivax sp.]|nr:lysine transporter LysE [Desulfovibrio sp.]MDO9072170.1 LysE family translocator [Rubrivivax sp.]
MITSLATAALSGAAFGLSAGLTPGPLLALVIAQTLAHGPREGGKVALAPLLTDTPIVLAAILLTRSAGGHGPILGAITLCGSAFLLYCAWGCLRFRPPGSGPDKGLGGQRQAKGPNSIRKGVLANFLNPGPYLFWMTVGAPLALESLGLGWLTLACFLGAFSLTICAAKLGVALFTWRSGPVLGSRGYVLVMRGLGGMLLVYAALFARDGSRLLFS